jgi:dienelactone hydrolase
MRLSPPARALYLQDGVERFAVFLHPGSGDSPRDTAVLICPPFGWEDVCSYRSRREWAEQLARAGYTTMRAELPSTGDSAGTPRDPARLQAWTSAVSCAVRELRAIGEPRRVAAIGIGLGGLLICRALAEGAQIDEAVLWASHSRGRSLLRELRMFSRFQDYEPEGLASGAGELPSDGDVAAGGFLLSAETVASLEQVDVADLPFAPGQLRRALLLGREDSSVDSRLQAHLEQAGVDVRSAPGPGYSEMMLKPHLARSPSAVFAQVESWLAESAAIVSAGAGSPAPAAQAPEQRAQATKPDSTAPELASARGELEVSVAGANVRERSLPFEQSGGKLYAVLSEPRDAQGSELCVVLLNSGAIRHIGPNRMWVEAARRWAGGGVPTVRMDLEGIGDADGDGERFVELAELYVPSLVDQVRAGLDALQASGIGRRFVLVGLCSGAYWSFHGALQDDRVAAAFMVNPRAIFWDETLETSRDLRRGLLRPSAWRKLLRPEVRSEMSVGRIFKLAVQMPFALPRRAIKRWYARHIGGDEFDRALDEMAAADKHLQFLFSENEPLHEEFVREGRLARLRERANVSVDEIPGRDHTLRPFESQRCAHEVLDRALERELGRLAERGSAPVERRAEPVERVIDAHSGGDQSVRVRRRAARTRLARLMPGAQR